MFFSWNQKVWPKGASPWEVQRQQRQDQQGRPQQDQIPVEGHIKSRPILILLIVFLFNI